MQMKKRNNMEDFSNMPELNFQGNKLLRNNYAELFEFIAAKSH